MQLIDKAKLLEYLAAIKPDEYVSAYGEAAVDVINHVETYVSEMPTIESEPVRHGRWIECDYKHMEHGMIETEPKAGLCCSECRTAFQKKKMTYKQYCAACGARMDATDTNVGGKGGADNAYFYEKNMIGGMWGNEVQHAEDHDSRQTPDSE